MTERPLEYCSVCEGPTGKAGAGEDSIFWLDGVVGPLCDTCNDKLREEVLDNIGATPEPGATLAEAEAKAQAEFETAQFKYSLAVMRLDTAKYEMRMRETAYRKAQERTRDANPAVCKTCGGSKEVRFSMVGLRTITPCPACSGG